MNESNTVPDPLPTKEQLLKVRYKKGTYGELLQSCLRHGLEKVLKGMEGVYQTYQNWEAHAWGDPATYGQARRLQAVLIQQATTIASLKQLKSEEDVIKRLAADYKPPKGRKKPSASK